MYKDEFVLEESRPKDLLMTQSSGSGSDYFSIGSKERSSVSSEDKMVPMETEDTVKQQQDNASVVASKKRRVQNSQKSSNKGDNNVTGYKVVSMNKQSNIKSNLRTVGRNFANQPSPSPCDMNSGSKSPTKHTSLVDKVRDAGTSRPQSLGVVPVFPKQEKEQGTSNNDFLPANHQLSSPQKGKKENAKATGQRFSPQSMLDNVKTQGQRFSPQSMYEDQPLSGPMQVVSTKLISNVKEEVQKQKQDSQTNPKPNVQSSNKGKVMFKSQTQSNNANNVKTATQNQQKPASNVKGNNSTSQGATPSYLMPTKASKTRQDPQETNLRDSKNKTWAQVNKNLPTDKQTAKTDIRGSVVKSTSEVVLKQGAKKGVVNTRNMNQPSTDSKSVSKSTVGAMVEPQQGGSMPRPVGIHKSASDPVVASKDVKTASSSNSVSTNSVKSTVAKANTKRSSSIERHHSNDSVATKATTSFERLNSNESAVKINIKSNSETMIEEASSRTPLKSSSDSNVSSKENVPNSHNKSRQSKPSNIQYKPASAGKAPLVEILPAGTPRTNKNKAHTPVQPIQTPVIVNPFEEIENQQNVQRANSKLSSTAYGYVVRPSVALEKSKSSLSMKNRCKSAKKKDSKPSSADKGGRRRGARSKDSKGSDDGNRPRSGKNKRVKSGKKHKKDLDNALSTQASKSDVAIISGKNWHLATGCVDTSDVQAVRMTGDDSSSSDDDDDIPCSPRSSMQIRLNLPVHPVPTSSNQSTPRFQEVKPELILERKYLPVMPNDGFAPMNLDMTQEHTNPMKLDLSRMLARENTEESLSPSVRDMVNRYVDHEMRCEPYDDQPYLEAPLGPQMDAMNAIQRDLMLGNLTPIPESPSLRSNQKLNKTLEAIRKFDANIQGNDLNDMLGIMHDGIVDNPQPLSAKNSINSSRDAGHPVLTHSASTNSTRGNSSRTQDRKLNTSSKERQSLRSSHEKLSASSERRVPNSGNKNDRSMNSLKDVNDSRRSSSNERGANSSAIRRSSSNERLNNSSGLKRSASNERISNSSGTNRGTLNSGRQETNPRSSSKERTPTSIATPKNTSASSQNRTLNSSARDKVSVFVSKERTYAGGNVRTSTNRALPSQPNSATNSNARNNSGIQSNSQTNASVRNTSGTQSLTKSAKLKQGLNLSSAGSQQDVLPSEGVQKINSAHIVPKLDYKWGENEEDEYDNIPEGQMSTRRERKFSESRVDDNIDDVIDEIMSNTMSSNASTLKANSYRKKSLSSTFSEADTRLLKQMQNNQKNSPFHSPALSESVRQSGSLEDLSAQHPTNPNLLKVFRGEDYQIGRKMKAMIDAGADQAKVKAMADIDKESKGLAKVLNSFKHMELYAGPVGGSVRASGSKDHGVGGSLRVSRDQLPHPEVSSMEPAACKKPPLGMVRPSSAGAGKVRSAGRFTEIKDEKSQSAVDRTPGRHVQSVQKVQLNFIHRLLCSQCKSYS